MRVNAETKKNRTTGYSNLHPNSTCPLNSRPLEDRVSPKYVCKVRAPSYSTLRVEPQMRGGGNADFYTETSRMIYADVETEVERLKDVGCDHTSDRRSRRRRKTVWRRLAKSMAKVA